MINEIRLSYNKVKDEYILRIERSNPIILKTMKEVIIEINRIMDGETATDKPAD